MKRTRLPFLPLLVGLAGLAVTGWLWNHELQTHARNLRDAFDFAVRDSAARIEERVASFEQSLRGVRGLFEATDPVTGEAFAHYVDQLSSGADFAGLRSIGYAPWSDGEQQAPVAYAAPVRDPALRDWQADLLAEPVMRAALQQARDSGGTAITQRLPLRDSKEAAMLLVMPLYARLQPHDSVAERRTRLRGWVFASFRIDDLMSSLYGEGARGLDLRIHDGVNVNEASRLFPAQLGPGADRPVARETQEFIGFAGHTWTLVVRQSPEFERRYSNDSARIIAVTGTGLSAVLAVLSWMLITARARAHTAARDMTQQLRASAERYRRIVETANEGIWLLDTDGRTSFVNPKMAQLLGYTPEELLGRLWIDFVHPEGPREGAEIRFRRKNGSELWATVSRSRVEPTGGRGGGDLAMVTDITERRLSESRRFQLEAQLQQSQKMEAIGTLAGGIAHDFNNILAAILGNVALADAELPPGHAARERLAQIRLAAERGRTLVQQIVAFSRRQPQTRVTQALQPVLEEAAQLLRATLPAGLVLELRMPAEPVLMDADATQLQQVLMNLCTNAWHAMEGGRGHIVIGLDPVVLDEDDAARWGLQAGPHAHLWVSDDGSGMDEATQLRIFEPFYTTKPVGQGTGLGLAVVHGIVHAHGGAITASSAPGRGSTFDMHFPIAAVAAAPAPQSLPAPPAPPPLQPGRGEHVLYVDDDLVMVTMVEGLLQVAGYRVSCESDPQRALQRALAVDDPVDLVVTDFNMPALSGLELARALARQRPDLPVIISSGYVTESLRTEAEAAGVRQVLQKEYTLERLVAIVADLLVESHHAGA